MSTTTLQQWRLKTGISVYHQNITWPTGNLLLVTVGLHTKDVGEMFNSWLTP